MAIGLLCLANSPPKYRWAFECLHWSKGILLSIDIDPCTSEVKKRGVPDSDEQQTSKNMLTPSSIPTKQPSSQEAPTSAQRPGKLTQAKTISTQVTRSSARPKSKSSQHPRSSQRQRPSVGKGERKIGFSCSPNGVPRARKPTYKGLRNALPALGRPLQSACRGVVGSCYRPPSGISGNRCAWSFLNCSQAATSPGFVSSSYPRIASRTVQVDRL